MLTGWGRGDYGKPLFPVQFCYEPKTALKKLLKKKKKTPGIYFGSKTVRCGHSHGLLSVSSICGPSRGQKKTQVGLYYL